jgi:hypothetical protein
MAADKHLSYLIRHMFGKGSMHGVEGRPSKCVIPAGIAYIFDTEMEL